MLGKNPNHRLQATHKSASPFLCFQALGAALLCAPEPKRYVPMMSGKHFILISVLLLGSGILSGCGGVQKARYYKPSLQDNSYESKDWATGLAVVKDDLCIFVSEGGSKVYRLYAAGPVGLPVFPIEAIGSDRDRPDYVDISVWFVPNEENGAYSFNPSQMELVFSNGDSRFPRTVQVSRFKTRWEKQTVYMFTPDIVENISYPEHWGPKPINDFEDPVQLWNWSRFNVHFEKPSTDAIPLTIKVGGVLKNGDAVSLPLLILKDTEETKYVVSGQSADGTSIAETPASPCREMFRGKEGLPGNGT